MDNTPRNPFFLPSGFEPQEQINILEATKENKERLDKIKERKRAEKKLHKLFKIMGASISMAKCNICTPSKKSTKKGQIQYGFDLTKWWGEQHE